jgi:hypothetical protein
MVHGPIVGGGDRRHRRRVLAGADVRAALGRRGTVGANVGGAGLWRPPLHKGRAGHLDRTVGVIVDAAPVRVAGHCRPTAVLALRYSRGDPALGRAVLDAPDVVRALGNSAVVGTGVFQWRRRSHGHPAHHRLRRGGECDPQSTLRVQSRTGHRRFILGHRRGATPRGRPGDGQLLEPSKSTALSLASGFPSALAAY